MTSIEKNDPLEGTSTENQHEGVWMAMDETIKAEDELLTKVLREPFEYNTPTLSSPQVENESQSSHYHPQFNEKDYLKRKKSKKGPKKKKHEDSTKPLEKPKTIPAKEDHTPAIPEVQEEKRERNIVDQTISVLPEIGEDEILATPPKQGWLSQLADASTETVTPAAIDTAPVVETPKDAKVKHRQKQEQGDATPTKSGRHHKHHHRRRHKSELQERRRPGVATIKENDKGSIPESTADGTALDTKDVEDMKFHRFEDLKGMHRRPVRLRRSGMTTHFSNQDLSASLRSLVSHIKPAPRKKTYDHRPHENFVELEELTTVGEDTEWKERARWIKFEEDVEESKRWGKPHIPSLSFHSLLELRRGLETGAVLLDLEQFDLSSIAEAVIEEMVITDQLPRAHSSKVLSALLSKHRHQHQMQRGLRRQSSSTNLAAFFGVEPKGTPLKPNETDGSTVREVSPAQEAKENVPLEPARPRTTSDASSQTPFSTLDYLDKTENRVGVSFAPEPTVSDDVENTTSDIRGRIPSDAEATAVMVGTMEELEKPAMAFVRLAKGCRLGNLTEVPLPVRFIFVMLGPPRDDDQYHEIGRSIATLMSDEIFHSLAYRAEQKEDILSAINQFLSDSIVLAPGDWDERVLLPILEGHSREVMKRRRKAAAAQRIPGKDDDPLLRTGRLFGGLVRDVQRKYPHYKSDFVDAFKNFKCLVTFIFVYFATIAPCVTYGGLLSKKTDGLIGLSESILATAIGGIFFGFCSGQPLMIVGVTGPVLVFEETIYYFCSENGLDYLALRFWIGLWIVVICTLVVAFEGCFLVKYFTRFTEEIFACLISFIFVYEALKFIYETFDDHPLTRTHKWHNQNINTTNDSDPTKSSEPRNEPNTALLTTILLFGTVLLTVQLRKFRHSHFFGKKGRRTVSDFGMAISIFAMSLLDYSIKDVYTQKMPELSSFKPTLPEKRGWFVAPAGIHVGWMFAAVIPAVFVSILLFMETELTGIVLNKKENNLRKGAGYNLDLLVVGLVCGLCSLMGLPWICAAPVRSVSHKNALTVMSTTHAPGERAYVVKVIEQRVTNIFIHIFIGLSVLMAPALEVIPIAVLFGVFVYLGTISLSGNQFVIRVVMFFMPPKHYPDFAFVRKVGGRKIHLFTLVQVLALCVLVATKMTIIAPLFPLFVIFLVPIRKQLYRFFDEKELTALDNEESVLYEDDLDEYNMIHVPI
ncbi:LOW QUALITY PROTEIN: band 3 anion transport protein-like [Dendronephthya gigantea]|uniref:LOW QUALITY PROTEIN: band 3 anion transport protein-like n=1 Tax=Dendronephthya gigantea TaxID=151771 RepID=UPI00106DA502|nr:LOW QUALITY PROTEIN: band 3 anion transport protein-like [Dendronephthya gigantea]